jgi:protein ImuB
MFCCIRDLANPPQLSALEEIARACSPRIERWRKDSVLVDACGLQRVIGPAPMIASEVERLALARGMTVRVAIASTMTAAALLCSGRKQTTIVPAGREAAALAPLRIGLLSELSEPLGPVALGLGPVYVGACLTSFLRWGLHTLGDLARLPEADVRTRLGDVGARLHQAARGLDAAPLVPMDEPVRFYERLELEWPIEGLEPLSFVLSRLCESLSEALERADRGAVSVTTRLRLVTRATHERVLTLPAPMRDARVLRGLILLDLESHGPAAAIDTVEVELGVTPGLIIQGSLLTRALPSPEALTTLIARLRALMGESRVGAPVLPETYDERLVMMQPFAPAAGPSRLRAEGASASLAVASAEAGPKAQGPREGSEGAFLGPVALGLGPCLRRYRLPIAISMTLDRGAPIRVRSVSRTVAGGPVLTSAGPWRSSGRWWDTTDERADASESRRSLGEGGMWDQDHWDIELPDGVYRVARDRATGRWAIEGAID